jgi:hypothetical protein
MVKSEPRASGSFWDKVETSGDTCWLWRGSSFWDGYGQVTSGGKLRRAHRVAWEKANGDIPPGMFVCHTCDVPLCCRPDHLFLGTPADNSRDMVEKGRSAPTAGELNPNCKLSWSKVDEIRVLHRDRTPMKDLSRQFGVSVSTLEKICGGKIWVRN